MSDPADDLDDLDGSDDGDDLEAETADDALDIAPYDDETGLERTRAAYTGADLEDEFQPVDEVELAEEGMLLDDPETIDGSGGRRSVDSLDPDDVGWDLDEQEGE
jgi:hypothetical protein